MWSRAEGGGKVKHFRRNAAHQGCSPSWRGASLCSEGPKTRARLYVSTRLEPKSGFKLLHVFTQSLDISHSVTIPENFCHGPETKF